MQLIWTDRAYLTIAIIGYFFVILACCLLYRKKKNNKKWNSNEPFLFIAAFLMIGELVFKSLFCLMQNWDPSLLPFEICGLWLLFAAMAIFSKKNSITYRIGYTLVYAISFFVSIIETIIPSAIYSSNGNGSIFADYLKFWSVFYHMSLFFCFIWLSITRPYKLRHRDIFYGALTGMFVLGLVTLLGWQIGANYAYILHPGVIAVPTWLSNLDGTAWYPIIWLFIYGIMVIVAGYTWKYVIDIFLPKYSPKMNKWCKKNVYIPTWKWMKRSWKTSNKFYEKKIAKPIRKFFKK